MVTRTEAPRRRGCARELRTDQRPRLPQAIADLRLMPAAAAKAAARELVAAYRAPAAAQPVPRSAEVRAELEAARAAALARLPPAFLPRLAETETRLHTTSLESAFSSKRFCDDSPLK
mgnify:CR=1 FL=1